MPKPVPVDWIKLQTRVKPANSELAVAVSMNVTIVCPPVTVTVAVPAPKLLLTSDPVGVLVTPARLVDKVPLMNGTLTAP